MNQSPQNNSVTKVTRPEGTSPIVLMCEHASHFIPEAFDDLGISEAAKQSHVAWDPGAFGVACAMSDHLDAVLVSSEISRLVYDCNRPPTSDDAMPTKSERFAIPGNQGMTQAQRQERIENYYEPFRTLTAAEIAKRPDAVVVTIHSFTPVYKGIRRDVEIGILHDDDARLADVFLTLAAKHTDHVVKRNAPYGPADGVTHTLKEHALSEGRLNVMIEVRNDLIASAPAQAAMAETLANWTKDALAQLEVIACKV